MIGRKRLARAKRARDMIFNGDPHMDVRSPDLAVFRRRCGEAVALTAEADPLPGGNEDDIVALLSWAAVGRCSPEPARRAFLAWVERNRRGIRRLGRLEGNRSYSVEQVLLRKNFACWWAFLWGGDTVLPKAAGCLESSLLLCPRYVELKPDRRLPRLVAPLNFLAEAGITAAGMRLSGSPGLAGRVRTRLVMASRSASLCGWREGAGLARWLLAAVWMQAIDAAGAGRNGASRVELQ